MYLFTTLEAELLVLSVVPPHYRRTNGIEILKISLRCGNDLERGHAQRKLTALSPDLEKIIIMASVPTTLKMRHHIHEDGSMEEQPDRKGGPMRTYFDGSHIVRLSHAVAVCIDKKAGTITTQCPKGYDLNPKAAAILANVFPGYAHETVRRRQQEDQHSCLPLTLLNVFAFAGQMKPAEKVDILSWRAALLDRLSLYEAAAADFPESGLAMAFNDQKNLMRETWGENLPVFCRKYAQPAPTVL